MMPLNKQLLAAAKGKDVAWTRSKLAEWGRLHAARTVASVAAFGLLAYQLSAAAKA